MQTTTNYPVILQTLSVFLLLQGSACGGEELEHTQGPAALILNQAWTLDTAEQASLQEHAPEELQCPPGAIIVTADDVLDIDTGQCNYIALVQPAQTSAPPGSNLLLQGAHLTLFNPQQDGERGHVALSVGPHLVWERHFPIPALAQAWEAHIPLPEGIQAGTPIRFHLHNHGANEWKLLNITIQPRTGSQ